MVVARHTQSAVKRKRRVVVGGKRTSLLLLLIDSRASNKFTPTIMKADNGRIVRRHQSVVMEEMPYQPTRETSNCRYLFIQDI